MTEETDIKQLARTAKVLVFRSPVTDLGGLNHLLDHRGKRWSTVELPMGTPEGRARFEELKRYTGHSTLPQIFIDGDFVGGIRSARERLEEETSVGRSSRPLSGPAALAGYAGLAPFVGLAAWMWAHAPASTTGDILTVYAAVVLSFIGAVHFGWALSEHADARRYGWSMIPALAAWILATLPVVAALPLLATALFGAWYVERRWFSRELPAWYGSLRVQLSFSAGACLLAGWLAVLVRG